MRIISFVILLNVFVFSQKQAEFPKDECVISVREYRNAKSLDSKKSKASNKEIGKFIPNNSEGEVTQRRFRIPNSKLFAFANVYYDDNMLYDGYPHAAIAITLAVSRNRKLSPLSVISIGTVHAQYEDFAQISVLVLARSRNKLFDVCMICRRKQRTE
jgi:hypothetical protein